MTETPAVDLTIHHNAKGVSDRFALGFTKVLRWGADTFFARRYGHRAIVLETVAAVPGMVGATLTHLRCLRRMEDDKGWIRTLMEEAENERMHLMTFIEVAKPTLFERIAVLAAQWVFYIGFFVLYLVSAKTAHRLVGYFEDGTPVLGLPGCVMYAKATVFDLLLPRIAAGVPITREDIGAMGEGGLCLGCTDCHYPVCPFGKGA